MKLSIICFSLTGLETASRLKTEFEKQGHRVLLASKSKYLKDSIQESVLKAVFLLMTGSYLWEPAALQ